MRSKEEAHDYRYFPDPDILPIVVDEAFHKRCADALPELPRPRMERFISQYGLPEYDAELLTADRATANYFEAAVNCYNEPKKVANWIMSETLREMNERQESMDACRMTPDHLAALVKLVDQGVISIKIGKDIFRELYESGAHPEAFCKDRNLIQISGEDELACVVDEVIAENPDEAARLKGGEKKLMSFFMGQVMRKTRGKANPKVVQELFKEKL
jgi:aspartyl-tRNA(Asn)/glutamyl-tRNA(Gln) amidotransferase subunit B